MKLVNDVAHTGPLQMVRTGFDRLWDWAIYQLHQGWTFLAKKLKRPYELAKWVVFWAVVLAAGLWLLYYLSMGLYLSFYLLVLRPPSVPTLLQPLNLRYPDPGTADYIYAYHCITPVTYPQTYNWKLSLELPENPTNFDTGVFMVSLALYPPDELPTQPHEEVRDMFYRHLQGNVGNPSIELEKTGDKIRIGSRPLMLRWRPDIYRWIQTIVYAFPRMVSDIIGLGWFEETQHMEVNMIERHETTLNSTYHTKQCFVVSINNPKVQIYKASIEATVLLEGWRYILYSWFWTCFFIGSFFIFCTLLTVITTYWSIVLISAVVKGELKFPKLWLSDEEQQMKDMKEAVASLRHQKRLETERKQSNEAIKFGEPKNNRELQRSPRQRTENSIFGPALNSPSLASVDRPPSWIDEPFELDIDDSSSLNLETSVVGDQSQKPPRKADPVFNQDWEPHRRSHRTSLESSSSNAGDSNMEDWPTRRNRFERDGDERTTSQPQSILNPFQPSNLKASEDHHHHHHEMDHQTSTHRTMFANLLSDEFPVPPSNGDHDPSHLSEQGFVASPSSNTDAEEAEPQVGLSDLLNDPPPSISSVPNPSDDRHDDDDDDDDPLDIDALQ